MVFEIEKYISLYLSKTYHLFIYLFCFILHTKHKFLKGRHAETHILDIADPHRGLTLFGPYYMGRITKFESNLILVNIVEYVTLFVSSVYIDKYTNTFFLN